MRADCPKRAVTLVLTNNRAKMLLTLRQHYTLEGKHTNYQRRDLNTSTLPVIVEKCDNRSMLDGRATHIDRYDRGMLYKTSNLNKGNATIYRFVSATAIHILYSTQFRSSLTIREQIINNINY